MLSTADLDRMSKDELLDLAWRSGRAGRMLMHTGQQALYDKYRTWEQLDPTVDVKDGSYPLIFGLPIAKRWGKTSWILWVKDEDARVRPNSRIRIATAAQNDIKEIVDQVAQMCFESCPLDMQPVYQGSRGALGEGFYYPHNGSFISLVGLNMRPNAGRGRRSDGDVISEAAFVSKLQYVVENVYLHSYQNVDHARLILESSAPVERETAWETVFLPDFTARGAYFTATIDDNPRLTQPKRLLYIAQMGGKHTVKCQREFYNVICADPETVVIPEFREHEHVQDVETPRFAHGYVAADPGQRDLFGLLWGHWDFARARLVVTKDWAERGALTKDVMKVMRAAEEELWGTTREDLDDRKGWDQFSPEAADRVTYWDGRECKPNPYARTCDDGGAGMFLNDLSNEYGMEITPTNKADSKEARLSAVRDAFANGQIVVHPRCTKLISHLKACRWNKRRTDFERTTTHGHFDLVDALVYLWRIVTPGINPNPPRRAQGHRGDVAPSWTLTKDAQESALEQMFGVGVGGEVVKW